MSTGSRTGLQAEINATPLIDVLLVLLIIFLVVMPILLHAETLHIPRSGDALVEPVPYVTVVVKPDLSRPRSRASALGDRARRAQVVFVDVDPAVPWRDAVDTIDRIRGVHGQVALKVKEVTP